MMFADTTLSFNSRNPRKNLPAEVRSKQAEGRFQNDFLKVWLKKNKRVGVGGAQFELSNYGIADYIWVNSSGQIDAFEFKLNDWKGGLMQAMRYRGYARRSYLVVPNTISERILAVADALRRTNVGVYTFDRINKEIKLLMSPRPAKPLSTDAYSRAMRILNRKRKFREISKERKATLATSKHFVDVGDASA